MQIDTMTTENTIAWRKSSYSGGNGNCVEVADDALDLVPVRDSKDPEGPHLRFPASSWSAFVADLKAGRFYL